jgi:biopolymer transport protein ExbD
MDLESGKVKIKTKLKPFTGKPDLTPLVDVLFLLLIFFMLSSSFVQVSGIKVELPEISYNSNLGIEKYVVTIDKNGRVFFNDSPVERWNTLKEELSRLGSRTESGTIILRADSKTDFGTVARIMSLAEEVNLNVFVVTIKNIRKDTKAVFKDPGADE